MLIRRLGWAGIEIEAAGHRAVVDLIESEGGLEPWVGEARTPLPSPAAPADVALVTHLHEDHADAAAIARALKAGAPLLRPAPASGPPLEIGSLMAAEQGIADLPSTVVEPWQTVEVGPFEITALPAADGLGDPQVSWVVAADGRRIVHCGDTMFHGWWWLAAMRHGPFDAAFLPVNGAVVDFPHRRPAIPLAIDMDPRQAAAAALALGARVAVPIHYDAFHRPPVYAQVDDPAGTFVREAGALGVDARVVEIGESLAA
jgi:L-ascorbate metabolism protein UlaG (beta-lactamase superfamily)